jgi:hypothetical protein
MAVGFLFPPLSLAKPQNPSAMNPNPENYVPDPLAFLPAEDAIIRALLDIYVAAGLSSEDALRSAVADYECQFVPAVACAA